MSQVWAGLRAWTQNVPKATTFLDLTDPPEPSFWVWMLSTFAFIGVVLLITLGLGASVGVFRIWILKRFPRNSLNGPEDEGMTRLHLLDRPRQSFDPDPEINP